MPKNSIPLVDTDSPYTLRKGKEYSITLLTDKNFVLRIINPNRAIVSCTVENGEGEVWITKNRRWVGSSYFLSIKPLYPRNVEFNTNITSPEDVERANNETVIPYDKEKFATKYSVAKKDITQIFLRRRLALEYGVRGADITFQPPAKGGHITIPDSIWELYIAPSGSNENTFKVKLIDPYIAYIIQDGDTLTSIANKYSKTSKGLKSLNPNVDLNKLYVGQVIKVG